MINQDLWDFLFKKYGGSEIKRFSIQHGSYYTQVEVQLRQLKVYLLYTNQLFLGGKSLEQLDVAYNIQLSRRKNYTDLKKRLVDHLHTHASLG